MNETKYTVKFTTVFRKDYKKAKKRRLPQEDVLVLTMTRTGTHSELFG